MTKQTVMPRRQRWSDEDIMLYWRPHLALRLGDCFTGFGIVGRTGGGKSSAPIPWLVRGAMRLDCGLVIFCSTSTDAEMYWNLARQMGKEQDVTEVSLTSGHSYDFLTGELEQTPAGKPAAMNLLEVLDHASGFLTGSGRRQNSESEFFRSRSRILLQHCLEIQLAATGRVNLVDVIDMVNSLPTKPDPRAIRDCRAFSTLQEACAKANAQQVHNLTRARAHLFDEWPNLAPETSTGIRATLLQLVEPFTLDPLNRLFCRPTTCSPKMALDGRIILVSLPVDQLGFQARVAQAIWKLGTQRTIRRRALPEDKSTIRPVMLVADEYQEIASLEEDARHQALARKYRASSILAVQSLQSIYSATGGEATAKAQALSLFSNLGTKVVCSIDDPETEKYFAELCGQEWKAVPAINEQVQVQPERRDNSRSYGVSFNLEKLPQLDGDELKQLKSGGTVNRCQVGAIVISAGKCYFPDGRWWMKVVFRQQGASTVAGMLADTVRLPADLPAAVEKALLVWDRCVTAGTKPFDGSLEKARSGLARRMGAMQRGYRVPDWLSSQTCSRLVWQPLAAVIVAMLLCGGAGQAWHEMGIISRIPVTGACLAGAFASLLAAATLFARGMAGAGRLARGVAAVAALFAIGMVLAAVAQEFLSTLA